MGARTAKDDTLLSAAYGIYDEAHGSQASGSTGSLLR